MTQAIESILAECLDAIEDGSMSVADCLQKYSDEAETLESLLLMATELRAVPSIAPRPAFQAASKSRLLDRLEREEAAASAAAPEPIETSSGTTSRSWWQRLFGPVARPLWAAAALALIAFLMIARPWSYTAHDVATVVIEDLPSPTKTASELALGQWEMAGASLMTIQEAVADNDATTAVQTLEQFVAQVDQTQAAVQNIEDRAARKQAAVQIQTQLYSTQIELAQLPQLGENNRAVVEAMRTTQRADATLQAVIRAETNNPTEALLLEGRWAGDSLMAVLRFAENGYPDIAETAALQYITHMNVLYDLLDQVSSTSDVKELVNILMGQQALLVELQEQMVLSTAVMEQLWQVWHLLTAQLSEQWPTAVTMLNLTATPSLTPSATATATPSMTPTLTRTPSPTHTPSVTPTPTATNTRWPTVTPSATFIPTVAPPPPPPPATATFTPSPTASATVTFTPSPTLTYTPTLTPTATLTPTITVTPTVQEPTPTPSKTPKPTATKSPTPSKTPQSNHTPIPTLTVTRKWQTPTPVYETATPTPEVRDSLTQVVTRIATSTP